MAKSYFGSYLVHISSQKTSFCSPDSIAFLNSVSDLEKAGPNDLVDGGKKVDPYPVPKVRSKKIKSLEYQSLICN